MARLPGRKGRVVFGMIGVDGGVGRRYRASCRMMGKTRVASMMGRDVGGRRSRGGTVVGPEMRGRLAVVYAGGGETGGIGEGVGGHNRVTTIAGRAGRGIEGRPGHVSGVDGVGGKGGGGGRRARLKDRNGGTLLGDGLNQSSHDATSGKKQKQKAVDSTSQLSNHEARRGWRVSQEEEEEEEDRKTYQSK